MAVKELDNIFKNLEDAKESVRAAILKVRAAKTSVVGFNGNAKTVLTQQLNALENALKQTVVGSTQYSINNLTEYVDRLPAETFKDSLEDDDDVFGEGIPSTHDELDDLNSNSDIDLTPNTALRESQRVLNKYIRSELKPKRESRRDGVLNFNTLREEYNRHQDNSGFDFSKSYEDFMPNEEDMFAEDKNYMSMRESQRQSNQEDLENSAEEERQQRLQESQELVNLVLNSSGSGSADVANKKTLRESKKTLDFKSLQPMGEKTSLNGVNLDGMASQGLDTSVSFKA